MANVEIDPKTGAPIVKPVVSDVSEQAVNKVADFMAKNDDPTPEQISQLEKELESDVKASEELGLPSRQEMLEFISGNYDVMPEDIILSIICPATENAPASNGGFLSHLGAAAVSSLVADIQNLFRNCGMDSMQQQRTFTELMKILGL